MKDSNSRTQAKVTGSPIDIMNVFSCSQNVNRQSIFSHYCTDKLFCRFLWLHYETKQCLKEVVFAQLVELTAWGNNMCFGNDALTFARDRWNDKLFVKTWIQFLF